MSDLNQESDPTESQGDGSTQNGRTFSQEDVNRMLAEDRRKHQQQRDEAAEKAKREAEEKAALEKGEYQTLAEKRKAELEAERETAKRLADELAELHAALKTQAEARLAKLPKELRELAPEGLKPQDLLSWAAKAEASAEKLTTKPGDRGTPPRPNEQRQRTNTTSDDEALNRHRANLPSL